MKVKEPPKLMYDIFKENDSIAIFIDGHSASLAARVIGMEIDWMNFADMFKHLARVKRLRFYLTATENNDYDHSSISKLSNWLSYHSYIVTERIGPLYKYDTGSTRFVGGEEEPIQKSGVKSGIEVCICSDVLTEVANKVDHVVLFTTNDEYEPLIRAVQQMGSTVTLLCNSLAVAQEYRNSSKNGERNKNGPSAIIPTALIKAADNFVELSEIRDYVENEKPKNEDN